MKRTFSEAEIINAAKTAHEVNRSYCRGMGDFSQLMWFAAPDWQRDSAVKGVHGVISGNNPEQSHQSWLAEKKATGWKYGPVKDEKKKEHPCMVSYEELPKTQRYKDTLFVVTVRGVLGL